MTLVAVTASVRPTALGVRPLWSAPYDEGDTMTLTPTSLYVNHHAFGSAKLNAYDLRSTAVPWLDDGGSLTAAAGRLVISDGNRAGGMSTVYRPDTLTELWRADGALTDCGAVLCGADATGLVGYDADTGARRWRAAGMATAWPLRQDRIMASSEQLDGRYQLIDPVTGRQLGTAGTGLGSWPTDGRSAIQGEAVASGAFVPRRSPGT
jgi:hypothetical protein